MSKSVALFTGGTIIDGTGSPARRGDVLVRGDSIVAVGSDIPTPSEADVVDISGRVITPGFIDLHSHADVSILAFPAADSALRQGVTTIATGNCGGGVAPIARRENVGDVAFAYDVAWGVEIDWSSFGEYAERLDGAGINVAPLVPHGAIRNLAIGMAPRASTESEHAAMCSLLNQALDDGAFGMSSGLEYQPGRWAEHAEMRALVQRVGQRGLLYATHMRGRAADHATATAEAIAAADDTGARLQLSHFAPRPNAPTDAREGAFQLLDDAAHSGMVGIDTFPEIWGPALLIDLLPAWVFHGTTDEVLERLGSADARVRIDEHVSAAGSFLAQIAGYEQIFLSDTPVGRDDVGRSLTDIAATSGRSIAGACCDLLAAAGSDYRSVAIRHIYATEPDLVRTMSLPYCSLASDGIVTTGEGHECPLTWNASTYGFTARALEQFVRRAELYSLEEAIRRMTSLPAQQLGTPARGVIEVGAYADLVVFDPTTVHDRSTPDDMARHPSGIDHVLINGGFAVRAGTLTTARHGRRLTP